MIVVYQLFRDKALFVEVWWDESGLQQVDIWLNQSRIMYKKGFSSRCAHKLHKITRPGMLCQMWGDL